MTILHYNQVNVKKILLKGLNNNEEYFKRNFNNYVPIRYGSEQEILCIQTPELFAPFGVTWYERGGGNNNDTDKNITTDNNCNLYSSEQQLPTTYQLSFSLDTSNPKTKVLHDFFRDVDSLIISKFAQNKFLLKKLGIKLKHKKTQQLKTEQEIQDELENFYYTPIIKDGKLKPDQIDYYPPLFSAKIMKNKYDNEIQTFCEKNGETVCLKDDNIKNIITKFSTCRCIIQISHIWTVNGRFGVSLQLKRCKVFEQQNTRDDTYQFLPDNDNDNNDK